MTHALQEETDDECTRPVALSPDRWLCLERTSALTIDGPDDFDDGERLVLHYSTVQDGIIYSVESAALFTADSVTEQTTWSGPMRTAPTDKAKNGSTCMQHAILMCAKDDRHLTLVPVSGCFCLPTNTVSAKCRTTAISSKVVAALTDLPTGPTPASEANVFCQTALPLVETFSITCLTRHIDTDFVLGASKVV